MATLNSLWEVAIKTSAVACALPVVGVRMCFRGFSGACDKAAALEPSSFTTCERRLWQPTTEGNRELHVTTAATSHHDAADLPACIAGSGPAAIPAAAHDGETAAHTASSCGSPRGVVTADDSSAAGSSSDESDGEEAAEAPLDQRAFLALHGLELFQPTRVLGGGAFGVVEEGTVRLPGGCLLRCARKTLKGPDARPALLAEVAAMQRLRGCPSAVQLLAHSARPRCRMLMELAELGTLHDELELAREYSDGTRMLLPEDCIRQVATSALEALSVLHSGGVGHFDLKPQNVLLQAERVMLGDLGACSARCPATGQYPVVGTLGWCAPEVEAAFKDPALPRHRIGPAADMYALGLLLAACAAYHRRHVDMRMLREGIKPLPDYVPESLKAFIAALLADDPSLRPSPQQALRSAFVTGAAAD